MNTFISRLLIILVAAGAVSACGTTEETFRDDFAEEQCLALETCQRFPAGLLTAVGAARNPDRVAPRIKAHEVLHRHIHLERHLNSGCHGRRQENRRCRNGTDKV